jgi:ADP-ribose pyrophosphatase YjhB (NUDIX family)
MKKYPNVSVKIIFKYKNQTLMLRHKNGAFDFPGGRMKWGESILGALNRELKEELNYSLKEEPKLFQVWNYISQDKKRHTVLINYILKLKKKPRLFSPEKSKILWLTKRELESMNIIKEKDFIDKIFNR